MLFSFLCSFLILRYKEENFKYVKCQILIPYYLAEIFSDEVVSQRSKILRFEVLLHLKKNNALIKIKIN